MVNFITCRDCIIYRTKTKVAIWHFDGRETVLHGFNETVFLPYAEFSNVAVIVGTGMSVYLVCRSTAEIRHIPSIPPSDTVFGYKDDQLFTEHGVYTFYENQMRLQQLYFYGLTWTRDLSKAYRIVKEGHGFNVREYVMNGDKLTRVRGISSHRTSVPEDAVQGDMALMYESEDRVVRDDGVYLLTFPQKDGPLTTLPKDLDRLVQSFLSLRYTAQGRWCLNTMREHNYQRACQVRDKLRLELAAAEREVLKFE